VPPVGRPRTFDQGLAKFYLTTPAFSWKRSGAKRVGSAGTST
jgi:hypothetical protein